MSEALSYQQMAEDVFGLAEALDLATADFVGYSLGGAVALQLAMSHPDSVRRFVFAGGACYDPAGFHPEILQALTAVTGPERSLPTARSCSSRRGRSWTAACGKCRSRTSRGTSAP